MKSNCHRFTIDIPNDLYNDVKIISTIFNESVKSVIVMALSNYIDSAENKERLSFSYKNMEKFIKRLK